MGGIKDHNVSDNALIQTHKVIGTGSVGRKIFYLGTDATQSYELMVNRGVPQEQIFNGLAAAMAATVASRGDIIEVLEYYTETFTGIADVTFKAGVKVLGNGIGESRPKLTFSTATGASLVMSGAGGALKNVIGIAGINGLTNPIHMQAAGLDIDIEWRDGSNTVEAAFVCVGTDAADDLTLKLKYQGFTAGDAADAAVLLDGSIGAEIDLDCYGIWSTAVVEFNDTAVVDVNVRGFFHNNGTTDFSKTVVDTATGSAWSVRGYDGDAEAPFNGGPGGVSGEDLGTVASDIVVIDGIVDDIYSDTTQLTSDVIVMDAVVDKIYSDTGNIRADVTEILSDLETIKSDLVATDAVVDAIYSDTGNIRADVTEILSDLETIASDLVATDAVVDAIYSDTGNIRTDVTEILSDLETIASDLVLVDGIVDTIYSDTTAMNARIATRMIVSDASTGNASDSTVINISDIGVLTGITQILEAIDAADGSLTVRVDGVQLIDTDTFTPNPHAASDVVVTSLAFNHPFETSLNILQQKSVAAGTITTFVAYTTD